MSLSKISSSLALFAALEGCAPAINSSPSNPAEHEILSTGDSDKPRFIMKSRAAAVDVFNCLSRERKIGDYATLAYEGLAGETAVNVISQPAIGKPRGDINLGLDITTEEQGKFIDMDLDGVANIGNQAVYAKLISEIALQCRAALK